MLELNDFVIHELKKFTKAAFNVDQIISNASELKYTRGVKELLISELREPSTDFVRLFARQVYAGTLTAKVMDQFTGIVRKSSQQLVNEMISERLKFALAKDNEVVQIQTAELETEAPASVGPKTEFTEVEQEAFLIVKTILRPFVDAKRIVHRDTVSYLNVLLDDNNRKTVCRLWLNGSKCYIGFLDAEKKETRYDLPDLDNLYEFTDRLKEAVERIDGKKAE